MRAGVRVVAATLLLGVGMHPTGALSRPAKHTLVPTVRFRAATPNSTPGNFSQTYTEGTGGTNTAGFVMVSLSEPVPTGVTVRLTSSGSATVGHGTGCVGQVDILFDEFQEQIQFPPNDTLPRLIRWTVCRDARDDEDTEQMVLTISLPQPSGAVVDQLANRATITITDDDPPPTLTIASLAITEPATSGATATGNVTVTLSGPSNRPVSLGVAVEEVPPNTQRITVGPVPEATGGRGCVDTVDFLTASHALVIPVSTTASTVVVTVCGDTRKEGSGTPGSSTAGKEVFQVRGTTIGNATFAQRIGYVLISDP